MTKTIVFFVVCAIAIGLVGNVFAHKGEVIGDYKVEVGWENEPPIAGQKNAIEIIVTVATEHDKEDNKTEMHDETIEHEGMTHDEHEEQMKEEEEHGEHDEMKHDESLKPGTGVSGLSDKLEAAVTLNKQKTTLHLTESSKVGVYHADYTPAEVGFPSVNLVGKIGQGDEFEITFHPEKVEDLSMLSPLKQIHANIAPIDVKCKEGFQLVQSDSERVACVSPAGAEKLVAWGWGIILS